MLQVVLIHEAEAGALAGGQGDGAPGESSLNIITCRL